MMDKDSDPRVVAPEDYLNAIDILNGYGERPGVAVFAMGNEKVSIDLPSGTNIVIGAKEDKQYASLFIFLHNSNLDHRIYRYSLVSGVADVIASGESLSFSTDLRISHAQVVNGELLYWTDSRESGNDIEGNPPRKINAVKGSLSKDAFEFEIYAGVAGEGQFANLNQYRFSILDNQGNETEVNTYVADGSAFENPVLGLEWLKTNLENDYNYPDSSFETCDGCKLKISIPQDANGRRLTLVAQEGDALLVETNIYPSTLAEHHIDLIKQPPHCAPTATFVNDISVSGNHVKNLCAQFRCRYVYDDYEQSAWGPVSNIALNIGTDGEPINKLNCIEVDFTDERLSQPTWLNIIRAVEVAVRDGNENDWRLVGRFEVCEIGIQRQYIKFYNDKQYSTLPSDDTSTDVELQVLKPFDFVPIRSMALDVSADSEGNNLLFLGGNEENYDNPDCIQFEVEAVEREEDCLVNIIGTVEIINDSNFAADPPDFSPYPLEGIVVYLAGTPYYAVSNNPADGTGDGSFIIYGVPRGRYILRAASYKCSFTNDHGPRYNLGNNLEWQRTSAPVIDMAGAVANGLCQYEREINLTPLVGDTFDLDTETGYGTVQVQNGHWSHRLIWDIEDESPQNNHDEAFVFSEIYLLDNNATIPNHATDADLEDYEAMIAAIGVERQEVVINPSFPSPKTLLTDHNGYCFYGEYSAADDTTYYPYQVQVNGNTIPVTAGGPVYVGDFSLMYDETITNKWANAAGIGGLSLYDPPNTAVTPPEYYSQFITIFNDGTLDIDGPFQLQSTATLIDGVTGLDGVIFVYTRTGRYAISGPDGLVSISYYIPYDTAPERNDDSIIAIFPPDICHTGSPETDTELVEVSGPITNGPTFQFDLSEMDLVPGRYLKGGGEYSFGIVYEDRGNRTPGAIFGAKLKIPAHIDGLTKWQMTWHLHSTPPEWATHYRIVRLLNAIHSVYVQWKVKDAIYVRIPSQLEGPITTSFAAGDATHILFQLFTPIAPAVDADPLTTFFFQQDGQQGYTPQIGDKVRLLLDADGNPTNTETNTYEADIVGTHVEDEKTYAIVPNVFGALEITDGFLAEYYTPVTALPEIYYEGGEDCYEIGDPGLPTRYHKGQTQDQDPGVLPATGRYTGGDTYWRRQKFTETGAYETEHQTPNRYISNVCQDIGRAFALSTDIQREYYYNRIRISGTYIANSAVNGMSSFASLEYKDINRQWGTIMFLGFVNNVLLAICKFKVQPLYIGKGELLYLSGQTNVGRSDQIIEIADESVTDYGTHDPMSVVIENGSAYFYDRFQGAVCRYAQNGVVPVTTKMVKFFRDIGLGHLETDAGYTIAGFDRRHQMYLITFIGVGPDRYNATIGYDEVKGGWSSFFSFIPQIYGRVGQELITFQPAIIDDEDYIMWRHFANDLYTKYYGEEFQPEITYFSNQYPALNKMFNHIRINSNKKFECPEILVPGNSDYELGMESLLLPNHFKSYEGQFRADFLRDINDTDSRFTSLDPGDRELAALLRGRRLRGEYMQVTIRAVDGQANTILTRADIYFTPSQISNP